MDENTRFQTGPCLPCQTGTHAACDQHINDGAVDALDFITVHCDCEHTDEEYWGIELGGYGGDAMPVVKVPSGFHAIADWLRTVANECETGKYDLYGLAEVLKGFLDGNDAREQLPEYTSW